MCIISTVLTVTTEALCCCATHVNWACILPVSIQTLIETKSWSIWLTVEGLKKSWLNRMSTGGLVVLAPPWLVSGECTSYSTSTIQMPYFLEERRWPKSLCSIFSLFSFILYQKSATIHIYLIFSVCIGKTTSLPLWHAISQIPARTYTSIFDLASLSGWHKCPRHSHHLFSPKYTENTVKMLL